MYLVHCQVVPVPSWWMWNSDCCPRQLLLSHFSQRSTTEDPKGNKFRFYYRKRRYSVTYTKAQKWLYVISDSNKGKNSGPYRVIKLLEGQRSIASCLKLEPFAELFWLTALHMRIAHVVWGEGVELFFVDLSSFVLHYNPNFMNKIKFNDKKK